MSKKFNWDPCVWHRDDEADSFLSEYFASLERNVLLIAGAGFDPRSTALCQRFSSITTNLRALFIKEQRPDPVNTLVARAATNMLLLSDLVPNNTVLSINIFDYDNAVVGGRNTVKAVSQQSFDGITDVVVDISALSIGTSYPLVRYLLERTAQLSHPRNLHLFVTPNAVLDESIVPIAGDTVGCVHGFRGGWSLDEKAGVAKLWLPQLSSGRQMPLQHIYDFITPDDTCPILPFPSTRPRLSDELADIFLKELESTWEVDPRDIIYAAEDDPLDLYQTILRIDDLRRPVFEDFGGSLLVLSPTGSKILALGALMAALERDLPVVYSESIGYDYVPATSEDVMPVGEPVEVAPVGEIPPKFKFIHVWLEGEAYLSPRRENIKR